MYASKLQYSLLLISNMRLKFKPDFKISLYTEILLIRYLIPKNDLS